MTLLEPLLVDIIAEICYKSPCFRVLIGFSGLTNYLHDGRARSVEEAILWHGGEALKSKEDFMKLEKSKREKVLEFLDSI